MKLNTLLSRLFPSPIPHLAAVLLITLVCSTPAFCGEIHDAAKKGDLAKVKALLKDNPDLIAGKDSAGATPLHWAVYGGHKDVVELLRQHGGHE
jgi:uncharacterized protein